MFEIRQKPFGDFTRLELVNPRNGELTSLVPAYGATVMELVLLFEGKTHPILLSYPNVEDMVSNRGFINSKLFPFPNRVDGGEYRFNGKKYKIPGNLKPGTHAIHGLVYDRPFELIDQQLKENYGSVSVAFAYEGELEYFPFPFLMEMKFRLDQSGFSCSTRITNTGSELMPFGDGWHPYFMVPEGHSIDDLFLKIPSVMKLEVDDLMIPTGNELGFNRFQKAEPIGQIRLDDGFRLSSGAERAEISLFDRIEMTKTTIWQENYPYLQIYTPPGRQSVAIEPMTCAANAFNNKMGLQLLEAGEVFKCSYGIFIDGF